MHWLVTDIPGNSEASLGQEVVPYESPQPSIGIHPMVFVLLQQRGQQTVYPPGWRQNFNTRDFAEVYDLTKSTILRQLLLSISIVEGKEIWVEANCKIHIILSSLCFSCNSSIL